MNLVDLIFKSGVVGCGGAGFPTHVKLNTQAEFLLINALECEPMLRTDRFVIRNHAAEIIRACEIVCEHLNANECIIVTKSDYKKEIACLETAILAAASRVKLHLVDSFYPAGDEQAVVLEATSRVVPAGSIPLDVGCVVSNVASMYCICNALNGIPFTHKYITVTGAVNNPTVLKVPIGTSFMDCLEAAGGTVLEDYHVLDGGPMMGKVMTKEQSKEAVVTKTTSGICIIENENRLSALSHTAVEHTIKQAKSACIQCSFCTQLCPRFLSGHPLEPHKIMRKIAYCGEIDDILDDEIIRSAAYCCECGICELYACPMFLQPRKVNAIIKSKLAKKGIKVPKQADEPIVDINRDFRKLPTRRAAFRAGVGEYYNIKIDSFKEFTPESVSIPLKQHIGAAAVPVVNDGEHAEQGALIAKCEDGKLGANIHASISGKVRLLDEKIVIE